MLVTLARKYAPKTAVGFHASAWGGSPASIASYLQAVGGGDADFVAIDPLDRDAGCFEAHTDPNCARSDGPWYWDETNKTSPNFHEHLAFMKTVATGLLVPALWWQVPFGVPSSTPGGTAGHYRDNRAHYLFGHIDEFIQAGAVGVGLWRGCRQPNLHHDRWRSVQERSEKLLREPHAAPLKGIDLETRRVDGARGGARPRRAVCVLHSLTLDGHPPVSPSRDDAPRQ